MSSKQFRIAVFASGNGSNAGQIFKYFKNHRDIEVVLLMSNNPDAYALKRAEEYRVRTATFDREEFRDGTKIMQVLREENVTHIVLAGFLWLIPRYLLQSYAERIINIHPALLPRYGGKGMYGSKVHAAVKAAGDEETGITIHLVNEKYDEGPILFQGKCAIAKHLTPEQIADCVHKLEHEHYPRVIEQWILQKR